jgi:hypothetical protein
MKSISPDFICLAPNQLNTSSILSSSLVLHAKFERGAIADSENSGCGRCHLFAILGCLAGQLPADGRRMGFRIGGPS